MSDAIPHNGAGFLKVVKIVYIDNAGRKQMKRLWHDDATKFIAELKAKEMKIEEIS